MHPIDPRRWIVARTSDENVRGLASVLGVQYRALPDRTLSDSALSRTRTASFAHD